MQVSDILRVKGGTLYTIAPDALVRDAIETMSRLDIGSLAVMNRGELAGMLTFREVIHTLAKNGCSLTNEQVSTVMDTHPATCTPTTDITEVRPLMLERHTRYMPQGLHPRLARRAGQGLSASTGGIIHPHERQHLRTPFRSHQFW